MIDSERLRCRVGQGTLRILSQLRIYNLAVRCPVRLVHELVALVFLKHLIKQVRVVKVDQVVRLETRVHVARHLG